jgi:hypothetical protein
VTNETQDHIKDKDGGDEKEPWRDIKLVLMWKRSAVSDMLQALSYTQNTVFFLNGRKAKK